jgi:hypothetical protein
MHRGTDPVSGTYGRLRCDGRRIDFRSDRDRRELSFDIGDVRRASLAAVGPWLRIRLASGPLREVWFSFEELPPRFDLATEYRLAGDAVRLHDELSAWLQVIRNGEQGAADNPVELPPELGRRLRELEEKRARAGLSDDESNELGQLYAERDGREYSNADSRPHPDADRRESTWPIRDVNTDAEGFFWYGGTSAISTVEKSRDATGKRPTRRSRI